MNILEEQVSDLTSLANSPIATVASIGMTALQPTSQQQQQSSEIQQQQQQQQQQIQLSRQPSRTQPSSESPSRGENRKRSHDDGGGGGSGGGGQTNGHGGGGFTHTRAKRNRYISIACNECKRRKIKCNGNTPCQRCGNLGLECQYAPNCCSAGSFRDSPEFRQMDAQLARLQEQVDGLYASMSALRAETMQRSLATAAAAAAVMPPHRRAPSTQQSTTDPELSSNAAPRAATAARHHAFRGPTSSAFNLDVANTTLHNMGYDTGLANDGLDEEEGTAAAAAAATNDQTPATTPPPPPPPPASAPMPLSLQLPPLRPTSALDPDALRDPIWALGLEEVVRLCRVFEEEIGLMYPVVSIESIIIHATNLYRFVGAALRSGIVMARGTKETGEERISDDRTLILKMIVAIAATMEANGASEIGSRLFESVRGKIDGILHAESVDVEKLPLLGFVAMYHFHCDSEALAWRINGQCARMCVELGLHRRDSLFSTFPDDEERAGAVRLFWSIYVMDRRLSFGTGMPFALQDTDIDPTLPEPEVPVPYINSMIEYSRISSRVWRSIAGFDSTPTEMKKEEVGYIDYQITQWQQSIPQELQLPTTNSNQPPSPRAIHRLQVLLYLRANQLRIYIYRPVLHSANSIVDNLRHAQTVVEIAKDTIRALTHLNQTTDIYRVQQMSFNYFLVSALAVLFLASCHAPVNFSAICRDEFIMALDLVKGFSTKSFVCKKLWKTIKGLKEIAPRLGLAPEPGNNGAPMSDNNDNNNSSSIEDPHSSAALAMAGLAGHEITAVPSTNSGGGGGYSDGSMGSTPINGFQMSHEMTSLFEAVLGGAAVGSSSGTHGYVGPALQDGGAMHGDGIVVGGGDDELYRQLRELF